MNERPIPKGFTACALPLLVTAVLAGCSVTDEQLGYDTNRLPACTIEGSMFESLPFDQWADKYHGWVDMVVTAHVDALRSISTTNLRCTDPDPLSLVTPSSALSNLAKTLAPWKDPERLATLSEMDIGPVLLEFLRIYECASLERDDGMEASSTSDGAGIPRGEFNKRVAILQDKIHEELLLARTSLNRTLTILGGMDVLRPLTAETECLKRSSLDMRNSLGLISDAAQCQPKAVGKTSLRDPPEITP